MPGRLELATETSARLLKHPNNIDDIICGVLRGEQTDLEVLADVSFHEQFLERCRTNGVSALVFHTIRDQFGWPPDIKEQLEMDAKTGVALEMLRRHHLRHLTDELSRRNLRFLVTKGESMALTHYSEPGTRTRNDSDLFISARDIHAVKKAVSEAGFIVATPTYKSHQFTVRGTCEPVDKLEIDIHWRILNTPRFARTISFEEAFAESVELPGTGGMRTPSPVDSLILACMHRVGSEWHDSYRLIWTYDIHLLLSPMTAAETTRFVARSIERNVQQACYDGIALAQKCFHTLFPSHLMEQLARPQLRRRVTDSNLGLLIFDLRELPTVADRVALLRELYFPSPNLLLEKYQKTSRIWLPILYLRQIFMGTAKRLTLR